GTDDTWSGWLGLCFCRRNLRCSQLLLVKEIPRNFFNFNTTGKSAAGGIKPQLVFSVLATALENIRLDTVNYLGLFQTLERPGLAQNGPERMARVARHASENDSGKAHSKPGTGCDSFEIGDQTANDRLIIPRIIPQ